MQASFFYIVKSILKIENNQFFVQWEDGNYNGTGWVTEEEFGDLPG